MAKMKEPDFTLFRSRVTVIAGLGGAATARMLVRWVLRTNRGDVFVTAGLMENHCPYSHGI